MLHNSGGTSGGHICVRMRSGVKGHRQGFLELCVLNNACLSFMCSE